MTQVRVPKTSELVAANLRGMIVTGQLVDGDFLPHEAELMRQFNVSRPTLREAVRVLEAEQLVEVRRGSRTGARVCVPGAEVVARPAALLLELSGATVADVFAARAVVEPAAARLLAARAEAPELADQLDERVSALPPYDDVAVFARATADFHLAVVQLSGSPTLTVIAGMLHEVVERHTRLAVEDADRSPSTYARAVRSYARLVTLVRDRQAEEAEAHWTRHMTAAGALLLRGQESLRVVDVLE